MNWTKNACAFAVASAVGLGALSAAPASALKAPYVTQPTTTLSTTNPAIQGDVDIKTKNLTPGETVAIRIRSPKPKTLKLLKANRKGKISTTVTMPKGYKCGHTLIVRGKSSGKVTRTHIVIGKRSRCR